MPFFGCIEHHEKAYLDKMSVLANEISMTLLLRVSGGLRLAPHEYQWGPYSGSGSCYRKTAMKGACMAFRNKRGDLTDGNPLVV